MPRAPELDEEPREPGLRERKKERVRAQLIEAAMRLFSKKGLDATTIDDIVGAVDVSRRTFFRYFDAKEDVLPAWFDTHVVSLLETIDERPAGEAPLTSLRHVMEAIARLYQSQRVHVLTIERVIEREPSLVARRYARMEEVSSSLAQRLVARSGKAKDEAGFRLLARVALASGRSAIERWVAGRGKGSLVDTLDECWGEVEKAFAPPRRHG
ncbi:MAG TPA: TetR family transcriptional regulator [Polyangiaceae bacterium]